MTKRQIIPYKNPLFISQTGSTRKYAILANWRMNNLSTVQDFCLSQNTTKGHGIRRYKRGNVSIKQDSQDNLPILFRPMKRPK